MRLARKTLGLSDIHLSSAGNARVKRPSPSLFLQLNLFRLSFLSSTSASPLFCLLTQPLLAYCCFLIYFALEWRHFKGHCFCTLSFGFTLSLIGPHIKTISVKLLRSSKPTLGANIFTRLSLLLSGSSVIHSPYLLNLLPWRWSQQASPERW
jgi:hypothetical protein